MAIISYIGVYLAQYQHYFRPVTTVKNNKRHVLVIQTVSVKLNVFVRII